VPLAPDPRLPAKVQVTVAGAPAETQVQPAEPVALVTTKPAGWLQPRISAAPST